MNINIAQLLQMQQEQEIILQMCKEYKDCIGCPIKENGYVQINQSKWSCENASEVQK